MKKSIHYLHNPGDINRDWVNIEKAAQISGLPLDWLEKAEREVRKELEEGGYRIKKKGALFMALKLEMEREIRLITISYRSFFGRREPRPIRVSSRGITSNGEIINLMLDEETTETNSSVEEAKSINQEKTNEEEEPEAPAE